MAKKILLTVLFLFVCIVAGFFIWRYVNYAKDENPDKTFLLPRLELSVIKITSLSSEKTEMTAKMLIKNQMPFSFTADSLQYRFFIDSVEVMKSRYEKSITLKGNDSSWISLPITIFNRDYVAVLNAKEQENIDSVVYRLQSTFFTDIIFKKRFNVDIKRYLPLIHIPEIMDQKMEVDSLNVSRAAIRFLVSIKNENIFPLKAKDIAYEFSVEDNEWSKGAIPGITEIKAKGVSELTIPVRISFKEVRKTLFDLLRKGGNVKYKLLLTLKSESENAMVQNSDIILESKGSVKSLIKFAKKE